MGGEHLLLDPEVEYLLREIAADPRSSLLRVSRPASLTPFLERSPPVSPNAAGLTAAERHLLLVHRSAVVDLLGSACLLRFYSNAERALTIHKSITLHQSMEIPDSATWSSLYQAIRDQAHSEPDATEILQRCIADNDLMSVSIADIAATALRIQPRDTIRIYAGFDLAQRSQFRSALRILRGVLAGPTKRIDASFAWEDVAFVHAKQDEYDLAIAAVKEAARLEPSRVELFMNWFFNACLAGAHGEACAAADAIGELISDDHPSLELFVFQISRQRERGDWRPTTESGHLLFRLRERFKGASRRIADVIN